MKLLKSLPSLSRVVAGSKATLELPLGVTYETLIFEVTSVAGGLSAASINQIAVLFNGEIKQKFNNLQRLIDLNTYYARGVDVVGANRIQFAIHFNRAELVDNIMRSAPGIGTDDLKTLHIELDIAAGAPADIAIKAHAAINPVRQPVGTFFKVTEIPFSSAVGGIVEQDKLIRGGFYAAIHLFKADVNAIELTANDTKIVDTTKQVLERFQKEAAPRARVPLTAKATHIDFLTSGNLFDSMPTAGLQDLRLKMDLGSAGAVDIVTETLDTIKAQ